MSRTHEKIPRTLSKVISFLNNTSSSLAVVGVVRAELVSVEVSLLVLGLTQVQFSKILLQVSAWSTCMGNIWLS